MASPGSVRSTRTTTTGAFYSTRTGTASKQSTARREPRAARESTTSGSASPTSQRAALSTRRLRPSSDCALWTLCYPASWRWQETSATSCSWRTGGPRPSMSISPSQLLTTRPSRSSTVSRRPPATATTERQAHGPSTTRATSAPSSSNPTATTSRPSTTTDEAAQRERVARLLARRRRKGATRAARGVRAVLGPDRDAARQQRAAASARRRARSHPRARARDVSGPRTGRAGRRAGLLLVRERGGRPRERLAHVRFEQLDQRRVAHRRPEELARPAAAHVVVVEDLSKMPATPVLAADVGEQPLLPERAPRGEEVRRASQRSPVCHRTTILPPESDGETAARV